MLGFLRANPHRPMLEILPDVIDLTPDTRTLLEVNIANMKQATGAMDDEETRLIHEIDARTELLRQVRICKRAFMASVEQMEAGDA